MKYVYFLSEYIYLQSEYILCVCIYVYSVCIYIHICVHIHSGHKHICLETEKEWYRRYKYVIIYVTFKFPSSCPVSHHVQHLVFSIYLCVLFNLLSIPDRHTLRPSPGRFIYIQLIICPLGDSNFLLNETRFLTFPSI